MVSFATASTTDSPDSLVLRTDSAQKTNLPTVDTDKLSVVVIDLVNARQRIQDQGLESTMADIVWANSAIDQINQEIKDIGLPDTYKVYPISRLLMDEVRIVIEAEDDETRNSIGMRLLALLNHGVQNSRVGLFDLKRMAVTPLMLNADGLSHDFSAVAELAFAIPDDFHRLRAGQCIINDTPYTNLPVDPDIGIVNNYHLEQQENSMAITVLVKFPNELIAQALAGAEIEVVEYILNQFHQYQINLDLSSKGSVFMTRLLTAAEIVRLSDVISEVLSLIGNIIKQLEQTYPQYSLVWGIAASEVQPYGVSRNDSPGVLLYQSFHNMGGSDLAKQVGKIDFGSKHQLLMAWDKTYPIKFGQVISQKTSMSTERTEIHLVDEVLPRDELYRLSSGMAALSNLLLRAQDINFIDTVAQEITTVANWTGDVFEHQLATESSIEFFMQRNKVAKAEARRILNEFTPEQAALIYMIVYSGNQISAKEIAMIAFKDPKAQYNDEIHAAMNQALDQATALGLVRFDDQTEMWIFDNNFAEEIRSQTNIEGLNPNELWKFLGHLNRTAELEIIKTGQLVSQSRIAHHTQMNPLQEPELVLYHYNEQSMPENQRLSKEERAARLAGGLQRRYLESESWNMLTPILFETDHTDESLTIGTRRMLLACKIMSYYMQARSDITKESLAALETEYLELVFSDRNSDGHPLETELIFKHLKFIDIKDIELKFENATDYLIYASILTQRLSQADNFDEDYQDALHRLTELSNRERATVRPYEKMIYRRALSLMALELVKVDFNKYIGSWLSKQSDNFVTRTSVWNKVRETIEIPWELIMKLVSAESGSRLMTRLRINQELFDLMANGRSLIKDADFYQHMLDTLYLAALNRDLESFLRQANNMLYAFILDFRALLKQHDALPIFVGMQLIPAIERVFKMTGELQETINSASTANYPSFLQDLPAEIQDTLNELAKMLASPPFVEEPVVEA